MNDPLCIGCSWTPSRAAYYCPSCKEIYDKLADERRKDRAAKERLSNR